MHCRAPLLHGASRDALQYVYDAVSREINAVTDNPIVFPDEDEVISGGNFHGQPMALAFDFMKMAIRVAPLLSWQWQDLPLSKDSLRPKAR